MSQTTSKEIGELLHAGRQRAMSEELARRVLTEAYRVALSVELHTEVVV